MGPPPKAPTTWIISTKSGAGDAREFFNSDVLDCDSLPTDLTPSDRTAYVETDSRIFIEQYTVKNILPRAQEGTETTYIVLSGDGGPADIVDMLLRRDDSKTYVPPVLGLLPFGTGNALANSYGLIRDDTRGLSTLSNGVARSLPTFKVTVSPGSQLITGEGTERTPLVPKELEEQRPGEPPVIYGVVVCSWGLHASLVADSDTVEYRKHGDQRFFMAGKELLAPSDGSESHRYRGRVWTIKTSADGTQERALVGGTEHMYVLVTLVSQLQKGFIISPDSVPLDGRLRLVHLGVMQPGEVMRILGLAGQGGEHVKEENVEYEEIEGLRVDFLEEEDRWRRVCVDGKIIQIPKDGWLEMRKETRESVKLIVPQDVHMRMPG